METILVLAAVIGSNNNGSDWRNGGTGAGGYTGRGGEAAIPYNTPGQPGTGGGGGAGSGGNNYYMGGGGGTGVYGQGPNGSGGNFTGNGRQGQPGQGGSGGQPGQSRPSGGHPGGIYGGAGGGTFGGNNQGGRGANGAVQAPCGAMIKFQKFSPVKMLIKVLLLLTNKSNVPVEISVTEAVHPFFGGIIPRYSTENHASIHSHLY